MEHTDNIDWGLHKKVYNEIADELDIEVLKNISKHPDGDEAILLRKRVDTEVNRQKLEQKTT